MQKSPTERETEKSTAGGRPLRVLICGGGCAGPALAFWLARSGHRVTVVERFPALRATGAQVDLRGQGIEAVKRMGLLDAVRAKLVDEAGVAFVDRHGKVKGTILANTSGKGAQTLTSEYEIMRGDVVRILYDATKDDVGCFHCLNEEGQKRYVGEVYRLLKPRGTLLLWALDNLTPSNIKLSPGYIENIFGDNFHLTKSQPSRRRVFFVKSHWYWLTSANG